MRATSIIVLSLLLVYSGVAWTFESCPVDGSHPGHAASEHHTHSHLVAMNDHEVGHPIPIIHCGILNWQLDSAVAVAGTETSPRKKAVVFHPACCGDAVSAELTSALWLEGVFKNIRAYSLAKDLAIHLFFSNLRI